jgi:hypothetical protein
MIKRSSQKLILWLAFFSLSYEISNAQNCFVNSRIHKITADVSPTIKSYMEILPVNYDSTSPKKYPLLVYIGGTGEMFQQPGGTDQDLCPALQYSMPWRFNVGQVPDVITDSVGHEFSFFVVMPFVTQWDQQYNIDPGAVIDYMFAHYPNKLDTNRIYLTAMSRGTDNIMGYITGSSVAAKKIAAVVAVSNCFPANVGTTTYAQQVSNLASGNTHLWGISCPGDVPCTERYIQSWVNSLDSLKPGNAFFTYATYACDTAGPNASHHYAWNSGYDPEYRYAPGNKNVYEWLLQFSKDNGGAPPPPPVQPSCDSVKISSDTVSIKFKGLVAPVVTVQVFNNSWATVYNQAFTNSPGSLTITSLPLGTYHVKVSLYTSSWVWVCDKSQDAVIGATVPPPPPPPPPPSGTPDCNKIHFTPLASAIRLNGLVAPVVGVQVFNNSWATVFNKSYTNSPDTVVISPLTAGIYHVKVDFDSASWANICEKMQDVTVTTTGGAANSTYTNSSGDLMNQSINKNIAVAPNPFVNTLYLTIGSNKNETGMITIVDLEGKILVKRSVSLQRGMNRFSIDDLSQYRAGSYILRLTTSDGVQNMRLIKQ